MQQLTAEIIFLEPDDQVPEMIRMLRFNGFEVEELTHWTDPCGPTRWILATTTERVETLTTLTEDNYGDWMGGLAEDYGGTVITAGRADAMREHRKRVEIADGSSPAKVAP